LKKKYGAMDLVDTKYLKRLEKKYSAVKKGPGAQYSLLA